MAKLNVYEIVTNKIIEALENGVVPWHKPWTAIGGPRNLQSKRPYRGINAFLLSMMPYESPYWTTYKGAQKSGGKVKTGEKGTLVVFWKIGDPKEQWNDEKQKMETKRSFILRYYYVFNLEQCEGIEAPKSKSEADFNPIEEAENVINNMPNPPKFQHNGWDRAFYNPRTDEVCLPKPEAFESAEAYYSTAFHELVHSTGHEKRLERQNWDEAAFGSESYSKEELVAEMGAAMLCGTVGIHTQIEASAAYIQSWLRKLNDDKKFVISAGAQAQKAADFIHSNAQEQENSESEAEAA